MSTPTPMYDKVYTPTAVAIVSPMEMETQGSPVQLGAKQGAKYCGSCCDLRRAVIILAIISIVPSSIGLVTSLIGVVAASGGAVAVNSDWNENSIDSDDPDYGTYVATAGFLALAGFSGLISVIYAVNILYNTFRLVAALKYNLCMLSTCIVVDCLSLGYFLFSSRVILVNFVYFVFWVLFVYPTIGLLLEVKNGIMSEASYAREAYSCCCQPKIPRFETERQDGFSDEVV